MKKNLLLFAVVAMFLISMVAGCAKPPTAEMDAVKAAVGEAVKIGAEKYTAPELKGVQDKIAAAEAEIKAQEGKIFKKYDKAKEILAAALTDAKTMTGLVPVRKQAAKDAAVAARADAAAAVTQASDLLAKAPTGKGTKADIEAFKGDIAGLSAELTGIDGQITREEYFEAKAKADAVKSRATSIADEIKAAIEKMAAARKRR